MVEGTLQETDESLCFDSLRQKSLPELTFLQSMVQVLLAIVLAAFMIYPFWFRFFRDIASIAFGFGAIVVGCLAGQRSHHLLGKGFRHNWATLTASIIVGFGVTTALYMAFYFFRLEGY